MLKVALPSKWTFIACMLWCNLLMSQYGLQSILVKHPFQVLTARTGYQNMYQDSKGWFYIATSDGIIQYDGINEWFIQHSEITAEHHISAVAEIAEGVLLFGCNDGSLYSINDRILSEWKLKSTPVKVAISKIEVDSNKNVWLATKGEGVYVYTQKECLHFEVADGLKDLNINDMIVSNHGGVLVASDRGLYQLELQSNQKKCNRVHLPSLPEEDIIQNILPANNSYVLNSLSKGPLVWNPKDNGIKILWPAWNKRNILKMAVYNKLLFILTEHSYVFGTVDEGLTECKDPNIEFKSVESVSIDKMHNVWLLHKSKGLLSFYTPVLQYNLENLNVQCLYLDTSRQILLTGTTHGLYFMDIHTGKIVNTSLLEYNLNSIFPSTEAHWIWLASYGKGLIYYNYMSGQQISVTKNQGLPDNNLLQITGNDRYIWISTLGGIVRMQNRRPDTKNVLENIQVYTQKQQLPTNFIYQIVADSSHNLYVASDGYGISYLENGESNFRPLISELSATSILSIEQIRKDRMIINAPKKGIGIIHAGVDTIHWLQSDLRYGGFESNCLLNDSVLLAASIGYITIINLNSEYSLTLDEELGLSDLRPSVNAIYKDPFGVAWIACQNNVYRVSQKIVNTIQAPQFSFKKIQQFEKNLPMIQGAVFNSDQNQLSFDFAAIHYLATDHLQYKFILEGYEKTWHYAKEGKASYSNLNPGTYTLVVQASTDKSFICKSQIQYAFTIQPPFWKRWWFILLASSILIIGFRYGIRYREKQRIKAEETKRKTAELEFELLKNQVNPHFLFNSFNSLIALIEENPGKAIEFTDKLSDYFRNMLFYRDQPLIELREEIKLLQNYFDLLKLRFSENINLKLTGEDYNCKIAPLTLQLLLENAIKHNDFSKLKPMFIFVDINERGIFFKNTLNRKKNMKDSTGFGLESIRIRYQLLTDKSISVSQDDHYFTVIVPAIN